MQMPSSVIYGRIAGAIVMLSSCFPNPRISTILLTKSRSPISKSLSLYYPEDPCPKPKRKMVFSPVSHSRAFHCTNTMKSIPFPAERTKICRERKSDEGSKLDGESERFLQPLVVVSFYKFADFPDHAQMRLPLKELCEQERVSGGIILAPEGINGSICGTRESVEKVLGFIEEDKRLKGLRQIESPVSAEEEAIHHGHTSHSPLGAGEDAPFRWDHVRVKVKKEIVSLGMPNVSPIKGVGKYVNPRDWNALISDPVTVVIDVRNYYETRIGKFKGAVDPCTTAFRDFPTWVDHQLPIVGSTDQATFNGLNINSKNDFQERKAPPRVAMYCTGGIRCEKASSFLLSNGFQEVYHLEGGILKYLEEIPEQESLWEGECFVFDKRVSVEHGLKQGTFKLCYGCKKPISDLDMESPDFEEGVSCPYCHSIKSEEEKARARARQRQFETWGIIGGPDKGRRPISVNPEEDGNAKLSKTI
ncbi:rhodanese-like domain-containing protein 7 [Amborella trichopoda]|nr:rhodanese-like domain-containing protein 7 [Amborella trichopoda]|eukprot:XP_006842503.2 rhodanese-like domain-containing protein 7 [Amborella trichopoda]